MERKQNNSNKKHRRINRAITLASLSPFTNHIKENNHVRVKWVVNLFNEPHGGARARIVHLINTRSSYEMIYSVATFIFRVRADNMAADLTSTAGTDATCSRPIAFLPLALIRNPQRDLLFPIAMIGLPT